MRPEKFVLLMIKKLIFRLQMMKKPLPRPSKDIEVDRYDLGYNDAIKEVQDILEEMKRGL